MDASAQRKARQGKDPFLNRMRGLYVGSTQHRETSLKPPNRTGANIPPTLLSRGAVGFWVAVVLTGVGAGIGAAALTTLLETVQRVMWPGPNLLDAATHAGEWRHVWVLLGAGVLTGAGQVILAG
jgi:hypothetical protein